MDKSKIAKIFGSMGGKARAKAMPPADRKESARKAAILRWYPSVEVYAKLSSNRFAKERYLYEMREQRDEKMRQELLARLKAEATQTRQSPPNK